MKQIVFRCKNCVMISTRPRLTFNKDGICSACQWAKEKKKIDWKSKKKKLVKLLSKHKLQSKNQSFNCLVPCSGGKDGSYVAYNLKHKFKMKPLCVTVNPHLPTEVGKNNLENFIKSGYDHISINPDYELMRLMNRYGFETVGFPYFGWLVAIQTAVVKTALDLKINLIFYGEDGELEYGGKSRTKKNPIFKVDYQKEIYTENSFEKVIKKIKNKDKYNFSYFKFESNKNKQLKKIDLTHWSSYEDWDPYRNYVVAKKFCNLQESSSNNTGTFTNFAQNDQALVALHTYMMFLKFGFGRTSADAAIEVRRGAMDRNQAINLVKLYDGLYPIEFESLYLDYYKMSKKEFHNILDKFANKKILKKKGNSWVLKGAIN